MKYIKRYTKNDLHNYSLVKEFDEQSESFSYAIGITEDKLLITKLDFSGNVVWEIGYIDLNLPLDPKGFTDIIQVGSNSNPIIYVLSYYTRDSHCGLMAIRPDGSIQWQKIIQENCTHFLIASVPNQDYFFLTLNQPGETLTISRFSETGTIQMTRNVESEFSFTTVANSFKGDYLHLCGAVDDSGTFIPAHFKIDLGLELFEASVFTELTGMAQSLYIQSPDQIIISGYYEGSDMVFFTSYPVTNNFTSCFLIEDTHGMHSKVLWPSYNSFYLHLYDDYGFLLKLNSSNEIEWNKSLEYQAEETNGFKSLTVKNQQFSFTSHWSSEGDLIGKSLLDFETCKTISEAIPRIEEINCRTEKIIYHFQEQQLILENTQFQRYDLSPGEEIICAPEITHQQPSWNEFTNLQSSSFVLSAAGSDESDGSAKGIHLRWDFTGILGDLHLPKGNYTEDTHYYNKQNDFVHLYRCPYTPVATVFDFSIAPQAVDHAKRIWIYNVNQKLVYLRFHSISQYNSVLTTINPLDQPISFLEAYQDHLIEFEARRDFFFGFQFSTSGMTQDSYVRLEALSSKEQGFLVPKFVHTRKKMENTDEDKTFYITNGKSIRFSATQCLISKLVIEFYCDFIVNANLTSSWDYKGAFSLSLADQIVQDQLEPTQELVNGKWLHFTDNECVNIDNYQHRWNGVTEGQDRNIKQVVALYLELSTNGSDNPRGIDYLEENEDEGMPLLDFLRAGSIDYHVARMMGLGTLDISEEVQDGETSYVYLAEYETLKDLQNPMSPNYRINLSMSLPTTIHDQRLPLPFELDEIIPGIVSINDPSQIHPYTDEEGYTHDGIYRYVSLKTSPVFEEEENLNFYASTTEYDSSTFSYSSFAGVEYKQNQENEWRKPELSYNSEYKTLNQYQEGSFEPVPLFIDEDHGIVYIHKQRDTGLHSYSLYGVNLFSRTTNGEQVKSISTELHPKNTLQPPHQFAAHLIVQEQPLLFSTEEEQMRLQSITEIDTTLVRLVFEYNAMQELKSYLIEDEFSLLSDQTLSSELISGLPNPYYSDQKEIYADKVEIYFRPETPQAVRGKVTSLYQHPTEPLLYVLETGPYTFPSSSSQLNGIETLLPELDSTNQNNFIGSVLTMGSQEFLVQSILATGDYPVFYVVPHPDSEAVQEGEIVQEPFVENDGLFIVVENLQEPATWNQPLHEEGGSNPHSFEVQLGVSQSNLWKVQREIVYDQDEDGNPIRFLQKSRGFWSEALIEQHSEVIDVIQNPDGTTESIYGFKGMYKVTFTDFILPPHEQYNAQGVSVEWFRGSIRLKTQANMQNLGTRKAFDVVAMGENVNGHLVLYFEDSQYPIDLQDVSAYDSVFQGTQIVNYYPGYKVFLYTNSILRLTKEATLPELIEDVKYTLFGLRSKQLYYSYTSKFSLPAMMYGQKHQQPSQPLQPEGVLYATRPDTEGKSTYTFEVSFGAAPTSDYTPYALLFLRSNEDALLNAMYDATTVHEIRNDLQELGGLDEVFVRLRWENFLDFEGLRTSGSYILLPPEGATSCSFPMPNHPVFIASINEFINWHNQNNGSFADATLLTTIQHLNQEVIGISNGVEAPLLVVDFIEQALENTFTPLTEVPIIYQYIKFNQLPIPIKQVLRDDQGFLLNPQDDAFQMAPMAKRKSSTTNSVQFSDFTLDGTSKNLYFYGVKEMSIQMQLGKMSKPLGPIKLVNTNPTYAPEVKEVYPILENKVLGITPQVQILINSYEPIHFIKRVKLYRTFDNAKSSSVLSMDPVKVFDVEEMAWEGQSNWMLTDDFSDLIEIPYNEPVYYRVVAEKRIEYSTIDANIIIDHAPSHASKLLAVIIPESYIPDTPTLVFFSEEPVNGVLNQVKLVWAKTCYRGSYHLYKMTPSGNWSKIFEISGNQETFVIDLETTTLGVSHLEIEDADQKPIYHHFKVVAENTSGMMSKEEKILTIYNEDIGGIGEMKVGATFYIR